MRWMRRTCHTLSISVPRAESVLLEILLPHESRGKGVTTETKSRKRGPGAGRPTLVPGEKKERVELYLAPTLAAHLEARDVPEADRRAVAVRRKREAAALLEKAEIESRIM